MTQWEQPRRGSDAREHEPETDQRGQGAREQGRPRRAFDAEPRHAERFGDRDAPREELGGGPRPVDRDRVEDEVEQVAADEQRRGDHGSSDRAQDRGDLQEQEDREAPAEVDLQVRRRDVGRDPFGSHHVAHDRVAAEDTERTEREPEERDERERAPCDATQARLVVASEREGEERDRAGGETVRDDGRDGRDVVADAERGEGHAGFAERAPTRGSERGSGGGRERAVEGALELPDHPEVDEVERRVERHAERHRRPEREHAEPERSFAQQAAPSVDHGGQARGGWHEASRGTNAESFCSRTRQ